MSYENTRRIDYIDAARGIAIISVVIGHMTSRFQGIGQYIYSFHIPLFFLLSGMLFFYNDNWININFGEIVKLKIRSILYPYYIFSCLNIIFAWCKNGINNSVSLFVSTIMFDGILSLWFLPALFIAEILFVGVMKYVVNKKWIRIIFLIVFVLTTVLCVSFFRESNLPYENYLRLINIFNRACIGFLFICIGYSYACLSEKNKLPSSLEIVLLVIAFLINICLCRRNFVDLHYSIIGNPIMYYINGILGAYFVIGMSKKIFYKISLIKFFGKNSLIVYATHFDFMLTTFSAFIASKIIKNHILIPALVILLSIETLLIIVINKYFRFLIDYKYLKYILKKSLNKFLIK